ncbi:unnamed protein product [Angiostrongylus costaricensis]|uniref:Complex1_LYR_dom domain-containing protein n=1 Tax=Angiostrongylus costaricensis TaxID=334426 RepID=A0A0R3PMG0_ANGCS|nr:unnamed protein product [Angiostrongylus costaricensis]
MTAPRRSTPNAKPQQNMFPQYNYREFAKRRVREYFLANRSVVDTNRQEELLKEGKEALEGIRRQVVLCGLFPHKKTVVEK